MSETVVVIDDGSLFVKAGFAGDPQPSNVLPNVYGKQKFGGTGAFVGEEALKKRGLLNLTFPVQKGSVIDWDAMEAVWQHTFDNALKVPASGQPVLLLNSVEANGYISQLATAIFERLNVPSLCIKNRAVLSLLAAGRDTGVVVESGDGITRVTAVVEGKITNEAQFREAGTELTELVRVSADFATNDIARAVKEQACYVALDYEKELASVEPFDAEPATGIPVILKKERIEVPEMMFRVSSESSGLGSVVCDVINLAPSEQREALFSGIILSGGNTLFPGFAERLKKDILEKTPNTGVNIIAEQERKWFAWAGGSTLTSTAGFADSLVTRQQFEELGPSAFV